MEAISPYLVVFEFMLAICGASLFFYDTFIKKQLLSKSSCYVLTVTVASLLWCLLTVDSAGRWLGLKTCLFVCCLYFAAKLPRQCMYLLIGLMFMRFFEGIDLGLLGTKYLALPFILTACGLFFIRIRKTQSYLILYVATFFEIVYAVYVGARGMAFSAILAIILAYSIRASRLFIRYGKWMPFLYWLSLVLVYYGLFMDIELVPISASNIERSSMVVATIENFFGYMISGPKEGFDSLVDPVINVFNFQHYDNVKGIDPHSFLLSLWRDEGAIFSLLWVFTWFIYWKKLKALQLSILEKKNRIAIAMLAIAVVQFSLSPPETGARLTVALIMGLVLGITNNPIRQSDIEIIREGSALKLEVLRDSK